MPIQEAFKTGGVEPTRQNRGEQWQQAGKGGYADTGGVRGCRSFPVEELAALFGCQ